jgi:hypothetical protein
MTGKPTLKTGRLICPPHTSLAPLHRVPGRAPGPGYDGLPDDKSPAQRTLHQSLLNRHIGHSNIYATLRDYGFALLWGCQPENMPQAGLALAISHDDGVCLGVILRTESGRQAVENDLLQQGWHLLVMEPSAVVQTPQDALDSLLAVMMYLGCRDLPAVERGVGDDAIVPNSLLRPIGQAPQGYERLWQALRVPLAIGFFTACLAIGLHFGTDREAVAAHWPSGMAIRARIASVAISPDGHALVALANGGKAFIPAHALQRNPERLHHLIVAWRQGKPLTFFATSAEHAAYGRQVGIRDGGVGRRPVAHR